MLDIKSKSDNFQILGTEEFSKRTNCEGADHCILTQVLIIY